MKVVLIIKTGALGDVLRTTSILPGLAARHAGVEIWWLTAPHAAALVRSHPLVSRVETVDPADDADVERAARLLAGRRFERVLSLDDEPGPCRIASALVGGDASGALTGAYEQDDGALVYTPDAAPWFDLGLLSVHGRERADELKRANAESHAALLARTVGVDADEPRLDLTQATRRFGERFRAEHVAIPRPWVGLNTGAGGRWASKRLPEERSVELARELARRRDGEIGFVLLGGPEERERNARLVSAFDAAALPYVDAGTGNPVLEFAAIVDSLDTLVTSDSLALHVAVARRVPVVAFFAPTPGAEIELFGRGEKVESTSPDYASYRHDADTSSLTVERIADATERTLALRRDGSS